MSWKSTKNTTRENIEKKIIEEINDIEKLNNDTLCDILEILGSDDSTEISAGYNYDIIKD